MFDLVALIKAAGYLGIFGIVFAESGLLIGIFLPGDSLLFTAGFLASQGYLDIRLLVIVTFLAAVLGDQTGYSIGRYFGPKIFKRPKSILFDPEYVVRARIFYERYGGKAITLARFMPVIRTIAPALAGVGVMRYATFLVYNVIGGLLWGVLLPLVGYYMGTSIPGVDRYIVPIVVGIIMLSVLPGALHILGDPTRRKQLREAFLAKFLRRR
ncbi:MAG TPA: VTT domain-containing protein [Candidatus Paceibacterota bacterium]